MNRRPSVSRSTTDLTDQNQDSTGPRRTQRSTAGKPPLRLAQGATTATQTATAQRQRPLHGSQSTLDLRQVTEETEPATEGSRVTVFCPRSNLDTRPTPDDVRQLQAQYTNTQVSPGASTRANDAVGSIVNMSIDELLQRTGFGDPPLQTQPETRPQPADTTLLQPPGASNASTPHLANAVPSPAGQGQVEVATEAIDESQRWMEENLDAVDNELETRVNNASARSSPPRRERRAGSALDDLRIRIGDMDELTDPEEELERYSVPSQMSQQDISTVGDRRKLDLTVPTPEELADELMAVTVVIPHPNTITPDFRDRLERFLKHRGVYIDVYRPVMSLLAAFANTVVKELTDRFSRTLDRRKNEFERDRAHLQEEARNAYEDAIRCEEQERRNHDQLQAAVEKMRTMHEVMTNLSAIQEEHEKTIWARERTIREMETQATNKSEEVEELRTVNNTNQNRIRDLIEQTESLQQGVHRDSATDADVKRAQELLQQHTKSAMQPETVTKIITLIQRMQVRIAAQAKTIKDRSAEVQTYQISQKDFDDAATSAQEKLRVKEKEHDTVRKEYTKAVSEHRIKYRELQIRHDKELQQQAKETDTVKARYNQLCDTEHRLREEMERVKEEREAARVALVQATDGETQDLKERLKSKAADLQGQINTNNYLNATIAEHEETIARMRATTTFPTTEATERAKKAEEALGETQKKLDTMSGLYDHSRQRYDELVASRTHCIHTACRECNPPMHYDASVNSSFDFVHGPEQEAVQKVETESHASVGTVVIKPKPPAKSEIPLNIEELFKMPDNEVLQHKGGGTVPPFDNTATPLAIYRGEPTANPWEWGERLIERVTERTQNVALRVNSEATAVLYIRRIIHTLICDTAKGFYRTYVELHSEDLDLFALLQHLAEQLPHNPKRLPDLDQIKQKPTEGVDDFFSVLVLASERLYPDNTDETREKSALAVARNLAKNCKERYRTELLVKMDMRIENPEPGETCLHFRQRMITALRGLQTLDSSYSNDARKQLFNNLDDQLKVDRTEAREEPNFSEELRQRGGCRGRPGGGRNRGFGGRPTHEATLRERQQTIQPTEQATRPNQQQATRGFAQGVDRRVYIPRPQPQANRFEERTGMTSLPFEAPYPTPMQAADGSNIVDACYNCFQAGHQTRNCPFERCQTICGTCGYSIQTDPHPPMDCQRQPKTNYGYTWIPIRQAILNWENARVTEGRRARLPRGPSQTFYRQVNQVTVADQQEPPPTEAQYEEEVQRRLQERINTMLAEHLPDQHQTEPQIRAMMVDNISPNGDDNHWTGTVVCVEPDTVGIRTTLADVEYQPTWGPQEVFTHLKHEVVKGRPKCEYEIHPSKAMCATALKQTASLARMTNAATLDSKVPATHAEFDQLVREGKSILHLQQSESPIVFYNKQGLPTFQTPGLVDTGANISIFPYGALQALGFSDKDIFACRHKHIVGVGGHKLTLRGCATIPFRFANKVPVYHTFHVLNPSEFTTSMFIIGADCLENIKPTVLLDTKNRKILIGEHKIPWGNQVRNLKAPVMLVEDIKFREDSETQMAKVSVDEWCYSTDRPDSDLAMVMEPSVKQQQVEPRVLRGIHEVQEHLITWTHIYKPRGSKTHWKEGEIIGWATLTLEDSIRCCETVIPEEVIDRIYEEEAHTPVITKVKAVLADALRPQVLPPLSPDPCDKKTTEIQEPGEHFLNDELWFRQAEAQEAATSEVMPSEILIPKDDYNIDEEFAKLGGGKTDDWVSVTPEEWRRIAMGPYGSTEIDPTTPLPEELQLPELNPDEEPPHELGDDSEHLVTEEHAMFEQIHDDIVNDNKRGITRRTDRKRVKPDRFQAA